jgi:hypothetical protein
MWRAVPTFWPSVPCRDTERQENRRARALLLFPDRVAELLDGRDALGPAAGPEGASCFELTLDEARTLVDELLAPAGGGVHEYWGIVVRLNGRLDATQPDAPDGNAAYFSFEGQLPDGTSAPYSLCRDCA